MQTSSALAVCGRRVLATLLVLTVVLGPVAPVRTDADAAVRTAAARPATSDTDAFLARYVTPAGRVVRLDQGSDTVSEGQAYALLIALAAGDATGFASVWNWTRRNLLRPDGLLARRWSDGAVVDATPASGADLDTAVALLRAADAFGVGAYRRSGAAMARSVLSNETVSTRVGLLVVADPWATGNPATLNPGSLVAGTAACLARATGDDRWRSVASATAAVDAQLARATLLPPDWAHAGTGGPIVNAASSPDGRKGPRYGLDAAQLVIRLAASCRAADRALAAKYAGRLGRPGAVGERTLAGADLVTWRSPATDVALYAARTASGDASGAAAALRSARALNATTPTYFGAAWIALGPLLLPGRTADCS